MLQIDLKPSGSASVLKRGLNRTNSAAAPVTNRPQSAKISNKMPNQSTRAAPGLNSYNSLNRANRIRSLAKIIDENKVLLDKL